jgi:hypothetical protein
MESSTEAMKTLELYSYMALYMRYICPSVPALSATWNVSLDQMGALRRVAEVSEVVDIRDFFELLQWKPTNAHTSLDLR